MIIYEKKISIKKMIKYRLDNLKDIENVASDP